MKNTITIDNLVFNLTDKQITVDKEKGKAIVKTGQKSKLGVLLLSIREDTANHTIIYKSGWKFQKIKCDFYYDSKVKAYFVK